MAAGAAGPQRILPKKVCFICSLYIVYCVLWLNVKKEKIMSATFASWTLTCFSQLCFPTLSQKCQLVPIWMADFMHFLSVTHLFGNKVVFAKSQVDVITAFSHVCHVGQSVRQSFPLQLDVCVQKKLPIRLDFIPMYSYCKWDQI